MFKRKYFPALAMLTLALLIMAACAPTPSATTPSAPGAASPSVPTVQPTSKTTGLEGLSDAQVKWLQAAQLGPFAPKEQDWKAIEDAARKEGKAVFYSSSSRWPDMVKGFEAAYPGIKVEAFDIGTVDAISKIKEESKAGAHTGDVAFIGAPEIVMGELAPKHLIWNFVPSNVAAVIPKEFQEPILTHRLGTRILIYNSEVYKKSPINNWWDLTKPEWKGKVQLKDIFESGENLDVFITFLQHNDDMVKAYKDAFGKDIVLDKDSPTATHQFIKDFLRNDPVFAGSDGDVSTNIGTKGQKNPPIGLTDYAKYRDVVSGKLFFEPVGDARPAPAVFYQSTLSIIDQAPHPNAAKLVIRWMMGDEKGGGGMAPWYVPGDYPVRIDVPVPKGALPFAELKAKSWVIDPAYAYKNSTAILDFWIANSRKKAP